MEVNAVQFFFPLGKPRVGKLLQVGFRETQRTAVKSLWIGPNEEDSLGLWLMIQRHDLDIHLLKNFFFFDYCKRFALPASAQPSLREGSGTPKSSVGKVRIPEAGSRQVRQAGLAWLGWATG